jgi:hypothetical protein
MRTYFILVAIVTSSFAIHPIHVSVCDMEFDRDEERLELTMRIFTDDLEQQIRKETGNNTMDILNPPQEFTTDQLFKEYLNRHFKLEVNGVFSPYEYLGHEVEAGSVYCYMMVPDIKELSSLTVFNDILLDIFEDQVNLIHVEVDGDTDTMMFKEGRSTNSLDL